MICKYLNDDIYEEENKYSKKYLMENISQYSLQDIEEEFQDDKDIVLEFLKKDASQIRYVSKKLLNDREFILEAIKYDDRILSYASEELRCDEEILLEASKLSCKNANVTKLIENSDNYNYFKEQIDYYFQDYGYILVYANDKIRKNKILNRILVLKNIDYFKYMPMELKNDVDYICKLLKKYPCIHFSGINKIYSFLGDKIKNDGDKIIKIYSACEKSYYDLDDFERIQFIKIPILSVIGNNLKKDKIFVQKFLNYEKFNNEDIDYIINNLNVVKFDEFENIYTFLPLNQK